MKTFLFVVFCLVLARPSFGQLTSQSSVESLDNEESIAKSDATSVSVGVSLAEATNISSAPVTEIVSAFGRAVSLGAHQRVWEKVSIIATNGNHVINHTNKIVEVESGLHRKQGNRWVETDPEIKIQPDGTAAATNSAHHSYFSANINGPHSVRFVTPDNKTLKTRILGLAYYDFHKRQSVMIAELKNSIGTIVGNNVVLYADAFDGVKADVRLTNTRDGLEQDVILREKLPLPEAYNFNPKTTWLEVWTEFIDAPQPIKHQQLRKGWKKSKVEKLLDFGAMKISDGTAFGLGAVPDKYEGIPVKKHWMQFSETNQFNQVTQRTFLIEELSYRAAAPKMRMLPDAQHAAVQPRNNPTIGIVSNKRLLPERLASNSKSDQRIQVASLMPAEPGFVVDYAILSAETDFTFKGDTTYYVSGNINLDGVTTIEAGTVIKYANDAAITILGTVNCQAKPYCPAVLTAYNDNSVGNVVPGPAFSSANRYANPALSLANGGDLHNLRIRYAKTGVFSSQNYTVSHSQFIHCDKALDIEQTSCRIKNVLMSDVGTGFFGADYYAVAEHLTFDLGNLANIWNYDSIYCTGFSDSSVTLINSLITRYTFNEVVQLSHGDDTVFLPSSEGVYQTAGAGNYYLADNSPYRNIGTASISSDLASALQKRTTYPPIVLANSSITVSTTFGPQAQRDGNFPDIGYHYDALDYLLGNLTIANATLNISPGTAIGGFGNYAIIVQPNGKLVGKGTPLSYNPMVRFDAVQEELDPNWNFSNWVGTLSAQWFNTSATPGDIRFAFTEFSGGDYYHLWCQTIASFNFTDCRFSGGRLFSGMPTFVSANCCYDRVVSSIWNTGT